jgi:hypothetical protein
LKCNRDQSETHVRQSIRYDNKTTTKWRPVLLTVSTSEVHHVTMTTRPFVSYSQDENKGSGNTVGYSYT